MKKMHTNTSKHMNKGGYSGIGMLPVYAGFITLLIALIPVFGLLASSVLILFASMSTAVIAVKYFHREKNVPSRFDTWKDSKKPRKTVAKRGLFHISQAIRHGS